MIKIITAPEKDYSLNNHINTKLFLAGGITNCPDWQKTFLSFFDKDFIYHDCLIKEKNDLNNLNLTIFNPRRENFPIGIKEESERQIVWEHENLENSDVIIYWFSRGSDNPIVFYELGKYIRSTKNIMIGIDPEFKRKDDVIIQTQLALKKKITFHDSVEDLFLGVLNFISTKESLVLTKTIGNNFSTWKL